ncbi:hypothetical protein [Halomicrobium salinisoli]|uniref:hypothetical protein n=1 Tax=Halomicrobium salinisoli TaxID=2878391 RepID=UPI001CF0A5EF|nr:hypothetical protein [Halomicrobium salinisoli]
MTDEDRRPRTGREDGATDPGDASASGRPDDTAVGFTWGETEQLTWLRGPDGGYKRVDPGFLETLHAVAAGERSLADLSNEERTAFEHLRREGFLDDSGTVRRVPTPDGIRLGPRLAAFGAAFGLLTLYVAYRFTAGADVPTVATADVSVLWQMLASLPVFVGMALVHEAGHYLAARPYMDTRVEPTLLNGVFPAVVTKTNDAWRCPRSVRIWINLAGPFADALQCLALAGLSLFVWSGSALLAVVPVFEYFRILFAVNPLVRGDGYWMIVDWFGATNLYTRGKRDLKNREPTLRAAFALGSVAFTVVGAAAMAFFLARMIGLA